MMIFNKVKYNPGRFSKVSVRPLGNDTLRVKYNQDSISGKLCMTGQGYYT